MKTKMKVCIILFLIISLECHSLAIHSRKTFRSDENSEDDSQPTILEKIKDAFRSKFQAAKDSKLFNFLFGAVMKILNMLNGNPLLNIGICAINSIEVYFLAAKFPQLQLSEIKEQVEEKKQNNKKIDFEKELLELEMQEDDEMGGDSEESEVAAMEADCSAKSAVLENIEKGTEEEITVSVIEGEGDFEDIIEEATEKKEEKENSLNSTKNKSKKKNKHKMFKKFKKAFKKKFEALLQKIKEFKKKIKEKFNKAIEKLGGKLGPIKEKILKLLDKPIVKTLLFFFECALPNIAELIVGGIGSVVKMFSGFQIVSVIKSGPKFVKGILDTFKSFRTGYLDKNIQSKYMNYGKGTASLLMVVILGAIGLATK